MHVLLENMCDISPSLESDKSFRKAVEYSQPIVGLSIFSKLASEQMDYLNLKFHDLRSFYSRRALKLRQENTIFANLTTLASRRHSEMIRYIVPRLSKHRLVQLICSKTTRLLSSNIL